MKKILVIAFVVLLASTTLALAAWKIVDLTAEEKPGREEQAASSSPEGGSGTESGDAAAENAEAPPEASGEGMQAASLPSGEDYSYEDPDRRYVTETQRHQNFFVALAEGRIVRLDALATDYQPAEDPSTSYLYFTVTTTDGLKHDGTMVLKQENGIWRIAAIRQLSGTLGGGTDYPVPPGFEDDLEREILELQEFLTKVAQGRLDYMVIDDVSHPSENETVLTGRVVGIGGRIENAVMTLRRDYNIWHLTDIEIL